MLPPEDPQGMSREAVLLQWERKIEEAERRPSRLERADEEVRERSAPTASLTEDAAHAAPRRFERRAEAGNLALAGERRAEPGDLALAGERRTISERRTIKITGRPAPPRRRRSVFERQLAQPDRIALWAFLLGLFLVAVAAGTAHA
jgi:hypothetical protein